jgi:hypothetical protein
MLCSSKLCETNSANVARFVSANRLFALTNSKCIAAGMDHVARIDACASCLARWQALAVAYSPLFCFARRPRVPPV